MKMYAKENLDLGPAKGMPKHKARRYKKGEEIKGISKEEAQGLYDQGLMDSDSHDEQRRVFELDMQISKAEAEMGKAKKEIENKKLEISELKKRLKGEGAGSDDKDDEK